MSKSPLKDFVKLKEMGVIIHNYSDTLLFLKDDILKELESSTQKKLSVLLGMNEPSVSLMVKFFKSLDSLNYTSDLKEFTVFYDNNTFTLERDLKDSMDSLDSTEPLESINSKDTISENN